MADLGQAAQRYVQSDARIDLTIRQVAVLSILCDQPGPHGTKDLAEKIRATKPVITRAIQHLTRLGMVQQRTAASDGRKRVIWPTSTGLAARETFRRDGGER